MSLSVVNNALSVSDVNSFLGSSLISLDRIDPVNKTSNFSVVDLYNVYIVSGSSANVSVTLPPASSNTGRILHFKNQSGTYTLISANSDVCPQNSLIPGTALLGAVNGNSTSIISNGIYWFIIRQSQV